eukprot:6283533-Amphidinium_carterae.1
MQSAARMWHSLMEIIQALSKGNKHVPYRNSVITILLRNAFGGSALSVHGMFQSQLHKVDCKEALVVCS